jgi:rhodanese-related sulfurtransferase
MRVKTSSCSTFASRTSFRSPTSAAISFRFGDLPARVNELDKNREIVVHCKMGGRSQKAAELLKQAGFTKIQNLAGGIQAWSEQIDPSVPKY